MIFFFLCPIKKFEFVIKKVVLNITIGVLLTLLDLNPFYGQRLALQSHFRRRRTRYLGRVYTACLQELLCKMK